MPRSLFVDAAVTQEDLRFKRDFANINCRFIRSITKTTVKRKEKQGMNFAPMPLSEDLIHIITSLTDAGYRADVVGGAVRDHLIGRQSYDHDITTSATPEEVKRVFAGERIVDTGIKHGTVTLVLGGLPYEITTWRVDGSYLDNRHPESVSFTRSLEEDLARRDFTVNAMCYNPTDGYTDIFGGASDIEAGIIRAVGEPARRFTEDALRIMRALRFCATLGFSMDVATADAARSLSHLLNNVSAERIYAELKKLIASDFAYEALVEYGDILLTVLPELGAIVLPERDKFKAASPMQRLLSLFILGSTDPGSAFSRAMCRLKTDSSVRRLGEGALGALFAMLDAPLTARFDALKLLSVYGADAVLCAAELAELTDRASDSEIALVRSAVSSGVPYKISELKISGNDLAALGFAGRGIGEALSRLLEGVMAGECENSLESLSLMARSIENN